MERSHRRKKKPTSNPTVYSYCRVSINATKMFSMGREQAWMFKEERRSAAAGVDSMGVNMNSEHLYGPWESRVNK
jgi:hypothetical protein